MVLTATGITKRYGRTLALGGVDFAARPGEIHALIGENGAGKSTLINILAGRTVPDAGRIELDGTDLCRIQLHDLRRAVATVFEDTFLFSDSVRGNIAFADPEASMEMLPSTLSVKLPETLWE